MLEFGVHEREIHVAEMFGYARDAGFDDVRVIVNSAPSLSDERALDAAARGPEGSLKALNGTMSPTCRRSSCSRCSTIRCCVPKGPPRA